MARRTKRSGSRAGLWVLLLVVIAAAVGTTWWLRQRRGETAGCPSLNGGAVAQSKTARFTTIEELRHELHPAGVVRVQAHLLEYSLAGSAYRMELGSLVDPSVSLVALLPPGSCMAHSEDAALLDELRQDFGLRIGQPGQAETRPDQPTTMVVTGVAERGPEGVRLRPVLDLHVQ